MYTYKVYVYVTIGEPWANIIKVFVKFRISWAVIMESEEEFLKYSTKEYCPQGNLSQKNAAGSSKSEAAIYGYP